MPAPRHFIELQRPLAVFDIESTGTSPRADRIVEMALVMLLPDGASATHVYRFCPCIPIPPEATRVHGITDADVAGCPTFAERAAEIAALLRDADIGGYNVLRFDIPMLMEEFRRAGVAFDLEGRRIVDAQRIYHRREPRDLSAALRFYCGDDHADAHGALGDALATVRVLDGQFARYPDLPRDINELHAYCNPRNPEWADGTGKLKWRDGEIVLNFGQRKGTPLRELIAKDPRYVRWMLASDFPADTRDIISEAIEGRWPPRQESQSPE